MITYTDGRRASVEKRSPVEKNLPKEKRSLWEDLTESEEYADFRKRVSEDLENDHLQEKMAKKRGEAKYAKRSLIGELLNSDKYANFRKRAAALMQPNLRTR